MKKFIAVDIGASSGRLIESYIENRKIQMKELYRFKNNFSLNGKYERWDIEYLVEEILNGLTIAKDKGITEAFVGFDTWAVDYCLLDNQGKLISQPIAYRDTRTESAVSEFQRKMDLDKLYEKTGIQIQSFNTLFQLFVEEKEKIKQAKTLLLIPDYLGYVFTGKMVTEKTNASTMQLLNTKTRTWDKKLLDILGISEKIFPPLVDPGSILGTLIKEKFPTYDLPDVTFLNVASHDTASAVLGTPGNGKNWAYISSGTWSLLGLETESFNLTKEAFLSNYTNEWGANNTVRFLKNIMGMWLIQEVARLQDYQYSYIQLAEMAETVPSFQQFIDINDPRFLNPKNMIQELQKYCRETNQIIPKTPAEIARCIFDNLALCYGKELKQLEKLSKEKIQKLHIVGGGSNNQLLNQLTADITGIEVVAGPSEATTIGNIIMQMLAIKEFDSFKAARQCVQDSFVLHFYQPQAIRQKALKNINE
ncbi:rhamnulokinase [Tetragenococcus halophilus]|uniref:rhamnulokinase n=1 Tax=Tetragenococcus halophilus TaxID=51669 RepID=UPI0015BB6546|nr:rhamnulokinase [Tetragenococcus halophilus]NWO00514.1 rhamnulokinase [Tetragenococcus halophilus]